MATDRSPDFRKVLDKIRAQMNIEDTLAEVSEVMELEEIFGPRLSCKERPTGVVTTTGGGIR